MTRVLILEPTTKDVSAASSFGEIVYLFENDCSRPSIWDTENYLLAVQQRLEELKFNDNDFFLAAGPTVPLMITMSLLASSLPEFRVLFWHAGIHEYVARSFNHKDYENATVS